jgi:phosphoglycolate phosphatase
VRYRALLYDLDGVLVRSAPAWFRVLRRATERFGVPPVDADVFRETFGQGMEADRARFFPGRTVAEIEAFYDAAFPAEVDSVELEPHAAELLTRARAAGIRQAVVTNAPRAVALAILDGKGLMPLLDAVAAAGDAPEKPAPDLVRLALARLRTRPEEALYVGDSATDVAAARAAGVRMAGLGVEADVSVASLRDVLALLA